MNILLLLKNDDRDQFITDYTEKKLTALGVKIHLLNTINVSGDIPVQPNGKVLDFCTEFDLSGYLKEAKTNEKYLKTIADERIVERHSIPGNSMAIIAHYVRENKIDVVIGGAHATSAMEDIFVNTFASRVLEHINVPYLTLKCDQSYSELKRIAIFRDFKNPKRENLKLVQQLAAENNSKVYLVKIKTADELLDTEKLLEQMANFSRLNGIEAQCEIVISDNKETAIKAFVEEKEIDLIALGHFKEKGLLTFMAGDVKTDIVNHIYSPILIY